MSEDGSFSHGGIARKILFSYLLFAAVVMLVVVLSIGSIRKLHAVNRSIVSADLRLIELTDRMIDNVLAQETLGRRFSILRDDELRELLRGKEREYAGYLDELMAHPDRKDFPVEQVVSLSAGYEAALREWFGRPAASSGSEQGEFDESVKAGQKRLIAAIEEISAAARLNVDRKTRMAAEIGADAFRTMTIVSVVSIFLAAATALFIMRRIGGSVAQLKKALRQIARGNFEDLPRVQSPDELGELSQAVVEMARRLKKLEEIYLDTSPLTRLPGGIAIEKVLEKKLNAEVPFAFCLLDLDNFKAFADKYGYARGSEVIKVVARMVEEAVREHGCGEDFVGHIGGDDFVVVTGPECYPAICRAIIGDFDRVIPGFYEAEDRQRGYIPGKTRQGHDATFPIMSISIGVVTPHTRDAKDPVQIGEVAAELKEYAKSLPGSVYVDDAGGGKS